MAPRNSENSNVQILEPLAVTISQAVYLSGESRSKVYLLINEGKLEALKSNNKTLVTYASIKRHVSGLPKADFKRPRQPFATTLK